MIGTSIGQAFAQGVQGYRTAQQDTMKQEEALDNRRLKAQQLKNSIQQERMYSAQADIQENKAAVSQGATTEYKRAQMNNVANAFYRDWGEGVYPNLQALNQTIKDSPELGVAIGADNLVKYNPNDSKHKFTAEQMFKEQGINSDDMPNIEELGKQGYIAFTPDGQAVDLMTLFSATGGAKALPQSDYNKANQKVLGILQKPSGGYKAQSGFGKYFADVLAQDPSYRALYEADPTRARKKALEEYTAREKQPQVGAANDIKYMPQEDKNVLKKDIRTIQGKEHAPTSGSKKLTKNDKYELMVNEAKKLKMPTDKGYKIYDKYKNLSDEEQGRLNSFALSYLGDDDVKYDRLVKTLNTINSTDFGTADISEEIKEGAGIGDQVINKVVKFFAEPAGAVFQKQYKKVFNDLLTSNNSGHISQAEIENLKEAYASLNYDQRIVVKDFRGMISSVANNLMGLEKKNPLAANIVYGEQLNALKQIDNVLVDVINMNQKEDNLKLYDYKYPELLPKGLTTAQKFDKLVEEAE